MQAANNSGQSATQDTVDYVQVRDLTIGYGDKIIQQYLNFSIKKNDIFLLSAAAAAAKPPC